MTQKKSTRDQQLFKEAIRKMGGVIPLNHPSIIPPSQQSPAIRRQRIREEQPHQDQLSDQYQPNEDTISEYKKPGVQHRVLQKLRTGKYRLDAKLDLHGLTVREARPAVALFLNDCTTYQYQVVQIIHGKGYGSKQRVPVLKAKLIQWLGQYSNVLAFCPAVRAEGGSGVLTVLLQKQQKY